MPKEKTAELGKSFKRVYRNEITVEDSLVLAKKEISEVFSHKRETVEVGRPPRIFEVSKENQLCKCPKCGNIIEVTELGYRCCNSGCGLSLFKNNKLFESLDKKITKTLAKQIFTKGKVEFENLVSKKTGKTYNATLVADFSNKYVAFKFEFPKNDQNNEVK